MVEMIASAIAQPSLVDRAGHLSTLNYDVLNVAPRQVGTGGDKKELQHVSQGKKALKCFIQNILILVSAVRKVNTT